MQYTYKDKSKKTFSLPSLSHPDVEINVVKRLSTLQTTVFLQIV